MSFKTIDWEASGFFYSRFAPTQCYMVKQTHLEEVYETVILLSYSECRLQAARAEDAFRALILTSRGQHKIVDPYYIGSVPQHFVKRVC